MRNCSILLVEDDADDVFFLTEAFRRTGTDVSLHVANNGQEAIDYLTQTTERAADSGVPKPSLVLLDLNLPRKTGLEVLKWIRQHSLWNTVIVIILTSSTSDSDLDEAYRLGANSYIIKPSDATKLRELAQLLDQYWFKWNQAPLHKELPR